MSDLFPKQALRITLRKLFGNLQLNTERN